MTLNTTKSISFLSKSLGASKRALKARTEVVVIKKLEVSGFNSLSIAFKLIFPKDLFL